MYYILSVSTEKEDIGYYPQVSKSEGYDFGKPESYWNVTWNEKPNFNPYYDVKINYKSKATNLIDSLSGLQGLIIDNKFKSVLSDCYLPPHDFFSIDVSHRDKEKDYYWFHFVYNAIDFVDFPNTLFEIFRSDPFQIYETISVPCIEDLRMIKRELGFEKSIRPKAISVLDSFEEYDILSLWGIFPTILISERLKVTIEENGITGCCISSFDKLELP